MQGPQVLDISALKSLYPGGGAPAYGPRILAAERLSSDEGMKLRKRRATDVETVFGNVKRNWNFKRFTLRGLKKVAHEWRLLMMGHNLRKLTKTLMKSKEKETWALAGV